MLPAWAGLCGGCHGTAQPAANTAPTHTLTHDSARASRAHSHTHPGGVLAEAAVETLKARPAVPTALPASALRPLYPPTPAPAPQPGRQAGRVPAAGPASRDRGSGSRKMHHVGRSGQRPHPSAQQRL